MSVTGVLGVVSRVGRMAPVQELLAGVSAMKKRGQPSLLLSDDGMAAFVVFRRPPHPIRIGTTAIASSRTPLPVVLDGRLDNATQLLAQLDSAARARAAAGVEFLVRELFLWKGTAAFSLLKGDYALALYDPCEREVHLAVDMVGVRPLSYCIRPEVAVFASDNKGILAFPGVRREANDAALAECLLGYPTGTHHRGETFFAGIHAVSRGHFVTLSRKPAVVRQAQEFDLEAHCPRRSYRDLCEEFASLFEQAVLRRLDGDEPTAIMVSGGLDSSAIYCVASAARASVGGEQQMFGLSFSAEDGGLADERPYLQAVEERCGSGIARIAFEPLGFFDTLQEAILHSESVRFGCAGNLFARVHQAAVKGGASSLLNGYWGDETFSPENHWYQLLWSGRVWEFSRVIREHHRWIQETSVTPGESMLEVLRGTLGYLAPVRITNWRRRRAGSRGSHPLAHGRLGRFASAANVEEKVIAAAGRYPHWQRQRLDLPFVGQYLAAESRQLASVGLRSLFPFLDADLVQFALRCTGEELNPSGRYKGLLRDSLAHRLPERVRDRPNKGDYTRAYGDGVRTDLPRAFVAGHGFDRLVESGYLGRGGLQALRDRLDCSTDPSHTGAGNAGLSDCVGLACWLDAFILGGGN